MRSLTDYRANWGGTNERVELRQAHWNILAIPAIVLAVMAVLQIVSFGKFKDWLDSIRVGWPAVVAVVLIVAELWGAASLLQLNRNRLVRFIGLSLAA
jgi:hypothetical protein